MAIGTFKSSTHNMSLIQEQLLHEVIILLSLWFVDCVICSQSVVIKCTTAFIFPTEDSKVCRICSGHLYLPSLIPELTPRYFCDFLAALNNALRYHTIVTSRRIACVIGFIWTLSLLVAVFPFLGWREVRPRVVGGYCQYHLNLAPSYILFLHVTVCLTPLTTTCLAYCKIFQVARLQARKIASMTVRLSFVV